MGQWRTHEERHPKAKGKPVPVDASGRLPNGNTFETYNEFKGLLASQEERLARSYVKALMSYALGRPMGYTDSGEIDKIIQMGRDSNFDLMTLTYYVCASQSFRSK